MSVKTRKSSRSMNYRALVTAIGQVHQHAQAGAAGAVNRHLIVRNWIIGSYIVEYEQKGKDRATYGEGLLKRLARDLRSKRVAGTSPDML